MLHCMKNLTLALIAASSLALAPMAAGTAKADDDDHYGRNGWHRRGDGWRGDGSYWRGRHGGGYRGYQPYYGGGWYQPRYYRPYYYQPYYPQPYYYGSPYSGYYNSYGWGVRTPYLGIQVW
jgi:hypothetical protein